MIIYDKPFLTYEEQIQKKLKEEYGLTIENEDFAKLALVSMSYYELVNGYQECFMVNGKFIDGTTIEYLYDFHRFNLGLQNILIKYSILAETKFKSSLAYVLSDSFGVDENIYLNINNFNKRIDRRKLEKTLSFIKETYNTSNHEQPTAHYRDTKNHIPAWILLKNTTFNNSINLYIFLKEVEKNKLINIILPANSLSIDKRKELLKKALIITRKFRNKIAHNLKFVTYQSNERLPGFVNDIFKNSIYKNAPNSLGKNDALSFIISLILILNDPFLIHDLLKEITSQIELYNYLQKDYCQISKLPLDILNMFGIIDDLIINSTINYSDFSIIDLNYNY